MYAEGRGVGADPLEAHAWYSVAALRYPPEDADEAKRNRRDLDELGARLDPEQLARAKDRAAAIEALTRPAAHEPPKPLGPGEKATLLQYFLNTDDALHARLVVNFSIV